MKYVFVLLFLVFGFGPPAYADDEVLSVRGFRMDMTLEEHRALARKVCTQASNPSLWGKAPTSAHPGIFKDCYDGSFHAIRVHISDQTGKTDAIMVLFASEITPVFDLMMQKYGTDYVHLKHLVMPETWFNDFTVRLDMPLIFQKGGYLKPRVTIYREGFAYSLSVRRKYRTRR